MVEKPGWMGYDEPEEGEEEEGKQLHTVISNGRDILLIDFTGKSLEEIVEEYENSDTIEGPVNDNMELTEDPIINQGICLQITKNIQFKLLSVPKIRMFS